MSMTFKIILTLLILIVISIIALPHILTTAGLHPKFTYDIDVPNFENKKALIIATNHGTLNKPGETTGKPTGLFLSELSIPYFDLIKTNMSIDIASINGGLIPIEPVPWFIKSPEDKRFEKDKQLMSKLKNSLSIIDLDFADYDVVFLSGGWGAAYDLGFSELLATKISEAYYSKTIIGAICHGVLGLINAKDKDGNLLISGRKMTGVTDKQLNQLGISFTPQHPEEELKKAGAVFMAQTKRIDIFASMTVVDDEKKFVTGQNQNSGHETIYEIIKILSNND